MTKITAIDGQCLTRIRLGSCNDGLHSAYFDFPEHKTRTLFIYRMKLVLSSKFAKEATLQLKSVWKFNPLALSLSPVSQRLLKIVTG